MKEELIIACNYGGDNYVIVNIPSPYEDNKRVFRVYKNGDSLGGIDWNTLEGAVGHMLVDLPAFSVYKFNDIWG